ncbi:MULTISPECIES: RDD family protein [unclassified Pseudomonas]|uniref:RDD family protein n=1 Tax=unclassified Pseudomonas TaxID=196821 RepID=UPI0025F29BFA|nr:MULTISPECIES: RDD family protein [unclassified Pseudomonas]
MSFSQAWPRNTAQPAPLDTRIRMETPEGIDLVLRPAGLLSRSLAFTIDLLIRGAMLIALFFLLKALGEFGTGLFVLALFLVNWWYMVLFEVLHQGRTPGKQILGLRVVHDDGTPVGWSASLLRNLLRFVDMLPFGYTVGAFACLQHPLFKRLGDLAAGTLVIYRDTPMPRPVLPQVPGVVAPLVLTIEEQRAVLSFAERQEALAPARAQELAGILIAPLQMPTHMPAEHAVDHLNGIARGLAGSA